jgi:hypothetical protein
MVSAGEAPCRPPERTPIRATVNTEKQMPVLAPGVRGRSFKTVFRGYEPVSVCAALDGAGRAFEALERDVARLREQHAEAMREMDRMGELERSLLRSCVAAEEDARVRCGAARRYATRVIAAAEEQASACLEAPTRERDRIAREIEAIVERRREAAAALEGLMAALQRVPDPESEPMPAGGEEIDVEPPTVVMTAGVSDEHAMATMERQESAEPASSPIEPDVAVVESLGSRPREVVAVPATVTGASEGLPTATVPDGTGARRLRVTLVAGAAAALLLMLHGSGGVPRVGTAPPALAAASFAPLPAEPPVPASRDQRIGTSTGTKGTPPAAPPAAGLTIHIKPLRTCWVRVVVDGRTDARELQPGEDIVLNAQRTIVLRAGDAGALSLEVNGRVLPPLGLDGQVVERRFTAATAE